MKFGKVWSGSRFIITLQTKILMGYGNNSLSHNVVGITSW